MIVIEHAERWGFLSYINSEAELAEGQKRNLYTFIQRWYERSCKKRLDVFVNNDDGFVIAEEDLKIRGSGDIFGVDQSGEKFFRFFDISILDNEIIREADEIAKEMVKSNKDNCRRHLERWFALPEGFSLV